jgi:hypothetical protein
MTTHVTRASAAVLVALAGAGCVINVDGERVTVREEKRFAVESGADVSLETFDGSIRIRAWDRPEVLVEIEKRGPDRDEAASLEVRATQDGNRVSVVAPAPAVSREFVGIGNVTSPSVSYLVSVPRGVTLMAETRDGSISVDDLSGAITLRSGDGSIRAAGLEGDVGAHTEDGSVELSGRLRTVEVETGDGSVVVEAAEGSAMQRDWNVSTGDGSIVFRVPQGFSAEIDAASRDGRVRSEVEGLEEHRGDGSGSLRGRLGSGGPTVRLRTGDGTIRIANR